jgi:hypothetical protein
MIQFGKTKSGKTKFHNLNQNGKANNSTQVNCPLGRGLKTQAKNLWGADPKTSGKPNKGDVILIFNPR